MPVKEGFGNVDMMCMEQKTSDQAYINVAMRSFCVDSIKHKKGRSVECYFSTSDGGGDGYIIVTDEEAADEQKRIEAAAREEGKLYSRVRAALITMPSFENASEYESWSAHVDAKASEIVNLLQAGHNDGTEAFADRKICS